MNTEEGALFLLRRAKCIAEDAPLEASSPVDQDQAKAIAAQLDGLPLALDQAGAYIEETACGLSGYLNLYRKHAPDLLRLRGTLGTGRPDPMTSTWALSFEKIEKTPLRRNSYGFVPSSIPMESPKKCLVKAPRTRSGVGTRWIKRVWAE